MKQSKTKALEQYTFAYFGQRLYFTCVVRIVAGLFSYGAVMWESGREAIEAYARRVLSFFSLSSHHQPGPGSASTCTLCPGPSTPSRTTVGYHAYAGHVAAIVHVAARETDREGVAAAKSKCLHASLTRVPLLLSTGSRRGKRSSTTHHPFLFSIVQQPGRGPRAII